MTDKRIYQIGLTMINGVGDILARNLLQTLGDAEAVFAEKRQALEKIPGIGSVTAAEIKRPEVLQLAEKELSFVDKNKIEIYFLSDDTYPLRLRECQDAPVLFYFKGNTDLNNRRILSLVGTRNATNYGKEQIDSLLRDLSAIYPDLLIVSGLAYGIDIHAHRTALQQHLPTIGVLAHGLDRIYPSSHRDTAVKMLDNGGLLTEFPGGTQPDRANFIKRNRIVAGLSDATIVVESAEKGGSLITADIAFSYGRDVFAYPGRSTDIQSKGCNELIRQNKAALITSATDLISALCWDVQDVKLADTNKQTAFSFEEDTDDPLLLLIRQHDEIHVNTIALELGLPIHQVSALLFDLEMNGKVKSLPGNRYKRV